MVSQPQSSRSRGEGRAEALERLLRSERRALLRQAHLHSQTPEDADDALSDACVQFLRCYDGPAGVDALRWMLVVIKRCAWAVAKRDRALGRIVVSPGTEEAIDALALVFHEKRDPGEMLERAEDAAHVMGLLERLKPDERTALILLGLGCSYREIADLRGWSMTKVNRCVAEGRATVRNSIGGG